MLNAQRTFNLRKHGRQGSGAQPQSSSRIIASLVGGALFMAWVAAIVPVLTSESVPDESGYMILQVGKPALYYLTHGLAIMLGLLAGIYALVSHRFVVLSAGVRAAYVGLFASAAIWALTSYSAEELMSTAIVGATGPFVWLLTIFALAGTSPYVWRVVDPLIQCLAYATSVFAFREVLVTKFARYWGFTPYTGYTLLLIWLAGWTILTGTQKTGWRLYVRFIPYAALLLTAICSLSRSWTLLALLQLVAFVLLRARERGSLFHAVRMLLAAGVMVAMAGLLIYAVLPSTLDSSLNAFMSRIDEDTRSSQYVAFFRAVPVSALLLGSGPKGTWYWPGAGEFQFFDNGYLWMLFIGGVPTLIGYSMIVVWPGLRLMRRLPRGHDAAVVILSLFWALALAGVSTFALPGVSITSLLVLLWAGRCHSLLAHRREAKPAFASGFGRMAATARGRWTERRGLDEAPAEVA